MGIFRNPPPESSPRTKENLGRDPDTFQLLGKRGLPLKGPGPKPYPLKLQALGKLIFFKHMAHVTQKVEKLCLRGKKKSRATWPFLRGPGNCGGPSCFPLTTTQMAQNRPSLWLRVTHASNWRHPFTKSPTGLPIFPLGHHPHQGTLTFMGQTKKGNIGTPVQSGRNKWKASPGF